MTIVAISDLATVPVGADLTTEETRLEVLRGLETMKRVDVQLGSGVDLGLGEWAVVDSSGLAQRPTSTPVANTFLVFSGTDRFDVKATGQVTLIMNSLVIAKSSRYDTAQTYTPGAALTAKLLTGGVAGLTLQSGSQPIHARVVAAPAGGMLTFSTNVP